MHGRQPTSRPAAKPFDTAATGGPDDQAAEVARLEALGARRVSVGQGVQGEVSWVVMADPEGNEFDVLRRSPPRNWPAAE